MNNDIKKNGYSELTLYRDDGEILGAVHNKFGRIVIWNDTTPYIFKPPGMAYTQGEYSLLVKASSDKNKWEAGEEIHNVSNICIII